MVMIASWVGVVPRYMYLHEVGKKWPHEPGEMAAGVWDWLL